MYQIIFSLDENGKQQFEATKKLAGSTNDGEILSQALAIYHLLLDHKNKGYTLLLENERLQEIVEVPIEFKPTIIL